MTGHLLALEDPAGILVLTGRAMRAVAHRNAVAGPQTGEVVTLHGAGEALADGGSDHVDELAADEVVRRKLRSDLKQAAGLDPELGQLALGRDLRLGEVAALGLGQVLDLGLARAELNGVVAVGLPGSQPDDLAVLHPQDSHRQVPAFVGEHPGHAELARDHTGPHGLNPSA